MATTPERPLLCRAYRSPMDDADVVDSESSNTLDAQLRASGPATQETEVTAAQRIVELRGYRPATDAGAHRIVNRSTNRFLTFR
jgi:hypothetical protein